MSVDLALQIGGLIVGAVAAYFGASNAMRERLAKLEARADANAVAARDAYTHADSAHKRIDAVLSK